MSLYDLMDWVWYVFTTFTLLPIGIGMYNWKCLTSQERWLVSLVLGLFLLDVIATILRYNYIRNQFVYQFRTLIALAISVLFYQPVINWKFWPIWIATIIALLIPFEIVYWVGFNHINTLTLGVSWLILSVYAIHGLNLLFDRTGQKSLRRNPYLFFHLGLFVLGFFSSLAGFWENHFIETSLDLYFFFDTLAVIMRAIAFCLLAIGLDCCRRRSILVL